MLHLCLSVLVGDDVAIRRCQNKLTISGLRRRNFLASEWCRFEFRLAHQRALQDNINRLVIVLVDELEPGALDEDLRLYVRSANYLRWGEPNFWDRLLHSLAAREARRKLIVKRRPVHSTCNATDDIELK
ncbi:hypothetical protein MTO96_038203 [Rhipicephalus appendiculatus]